MDPSELRINNLVTVTNGTRIPLSTVFKIVTIKLFQVDLVRHDQIPAQVESFFQKNYYELTPIPLTEDWLKRFGFKINTKRDDESVSFDYMNIGLFYIGMFNDKGWLLDAFDSMPPMQYVHQLQNLYFALTGEELKLN